MNVLVVAGAVLALAVACGGNTGGSTGQSGTGGGAGEQGTGATGGTVGTGGNPSTGGSFGTGGEGGAAALDDAREAFVATATPLCEAMEAGGCSVAATVEGCVQLFEQGADLMTPQCLVAYTNAYECMLENDVDVCAEMDFEGPCAAELFVLTPCISSP